MRINKFMMSLLAVAALTFTSCSVSDNPSKPAEPVSLGLVSVLPTNNSNGIWTKANPFASTWNVSFTVTFAEEIVILQPNPQDVSLVNVYNNATVESKQFENTHWTLTPGKDANTVVVRLENETGNLIGIKFGDEGYKLSIPAGLIASAATGAKNEAVDVTVYTSAIAQEREGLPTALTVTSVAPTSANSDGIWTKANPFASTWNVSFTISFDEKVVIAQEKPEGVSLVNVYNGKAIEEKQFETTHWAVISGKDEKSVVVRLENEGGSNIGVKLTDEGYKLTIPAGVVTNEAGTVPNGEITGTFYSSQTAAERNGRPAYLTLVSVQPTNYDATNNLWAKPIFASNYNISFNLTFDEDVKIVSADPEGVALVDHSTKEDILKKHADLLFEEYHWTVVEVKNNPNTVTVKLVNPTLSVAGLKLVDEAYDLTIPAGIVSNVAGDILNSEVKGTFYSSEAAKQL